MGLRRPGSLDGPSFELGDRVRIRFLTVVLGVPPGDQLAVLSFDLDAAFREDVAEFLRDGGEVDEAALLVGPPVDVQTGGQLGPERGVVDPSDGGLVLLEEPGVERQPPPGRVLDLGRDDGVGMELRVDGAGRVLAEQRGGDPTGVDLVDAVGASPGDRPVVLEPPERRVHRCLVSSEHLGPHPRIGGERPQHRDRLRRRERAIEPAGRLAAELPSDLRPRGRVAAVEQLTQLRSGDLAFEAERAPPGAPPLSRWLVGVEVVVDRTAAQPAGTLLVLGQARVVVEQLPELLVGRLERLATHHDDHRPHGCPAACPVRYPARANALVCCLMTYYAAEGRESRVGCRFESAASGAVRLRGCVRHSSDAVRRRRA